MRSLISLIALALALYGGYTFYNSPTGQGAVETAKITKLGYEVVNEKDPAKVLEIVETNEDLVQQMIKDEMITEEQYGEFQEVMKELDANGQEVNKKTLAETYIKDQVTPDKFEEVLAILEKEKLELSDMNDIKNLLQ